jgi:hypothetical protein
MNMPEQQFEASDISRNNSRPAQLHLQLTQLLFLAGQVLVITYIK